MNENAILSQYEIQNRIGNGAFSQVYHGIHSPTNHDVAIKIVDFDKLEEDDRIGTIREVAALFQIDHPNIVSIYNFTFSDNKLYIFLEYLSHGTLLDKANRLHGIPEDQAREYFKEMLQALFYLHRTRGIVHRDLKLQNMMLTRDDHIKIIDFGFCNSMIKSNIFQTFVGTPGFTAPEVINTDGYTDKCDIFSLGACLYAMVAGRRPFDLQNKNKELLIEQINSLTFSDDKKTFSPELEILLKGMLAADPNQRLSLEQIFMSDWARCSFIPSIGLQSIVDLRRFVSKESFQFISRKNILKPNLVALNALKNFGYSTEKIATELRRGRITDGTAAYMIVLCSLSPEELEKEPLLNQEPSHQYSCTKKPPIITIPTSVKITRKRKSPNRRISDSLTSPTLKKLFPI